jgi:hypothetical protein
MNGGSTFLTWNMLPDSPVHSPIYTRTGVVIECGYSKYLLFRPKYLQFLLHFPW